MIGRLFKLKSKFKPTGDQPEAVAALYEGLKRGDRRTTNSRRARARRCVEPSACAASATSSSSRPAARTDPGAATTSSRTPTRTTIWPTRTRRNGMAALRFNKEETSRHEDMDYCIGRRACTAGCGTPGAGAAAEGPGAPAPG